ncbi:hypothetical protein PLICRDRAFT_227127 [Plicaturopsis crispa FD-325 SS-3]|nr:hypothetical protein PLICRDRAFT_227127 [Plicaturopsis crispa FD-325 SS-3]
MHPCLNVLDIVLLIFTEIAQGDLSLRTVSRRTLARLARTCRAFQAVALDLLWKEQTSMLPLLRCIAPDIWEEDVLPSGRVHLTLNRPILPHEWQRCRSYGARIKELSIIELDYSMESPELSLTMIMAAGANSILPNLRTLYWVWDEQVLLPVRLEPRLRCFSLTFRSESPTIVEKSLVLSLPLECPNVEDLTLRYHANIDGSFATTLACGWVRLQTLELCEINSRDLLRLSRQLPVLRELEFTWDEAVVSDYRLGEMPRSLGFPQLRILHCMHYEDDYLQTKALEIGTAFLRKLDAPELNDVRFTVSWNASSQTLSHSLFTVLGNLNHSSLVSIIMEVDSANVDFSMGVVRDLDNALRGKTMQPMLSCRHLTRFHWDCVDGFDLDDGDLVMIATSWPSLEHLHLSSGCRWSLPSRVTLQGLLKLLQLCPNLKSADLMINATEADASKFPTAQIIPHNALASMDLGYSPIADAEAVATILSRVAPCLLRVRSWYNWMPLEFDFPSEDEEAEYLQRWADVESILKSASRERAGDI